MTPLSRLLTFALVILLVLIVASQGLRWSVTNRSPVPPEGETRATISAPAHRASRAPDWRLLDRTLLVLSAVALVLAITLVFALGLRPHCGTDTRAPFAVRDRERRSLSLLAATSARAQEEISLERSGREKAEAASRQRLQLLNQALEEKVRIGRDLHDGVIQSLYAVGLNLESSRRIASRDADQAGDMVERSMTLIDRTIADIRAYIEGLSPQAVRGGSFASGLAEAIDDLRAGRPVEVTWEIDDAAVATLTDHQAAECLQITREAVSNALRHGGANRIQVQLAIAESGTALRVRDNGTGFDRSTEAGRGHGLPNMEQRARDADGAFTLTTTPGNGTSVHVLWQTPPSE